MKKLSRTQEALKGKLSDNIETAKDNLEAAISNYNNAMSIAWEAVTRKIELLNEAIEEAEGFRSEIETIQDEFFSERSEKWQEGDTGQMYQVWMSDWSNELSEIEMEEPEELEMPDVEAATNFEMLNTEP